MIIKSDFKISVLLNVFFIYFVIINVIYEFFVIYILKLILMVNKFFLNNVKRNRICDICVF